MSTIYMPDPNPGRCKNHRSEGEETLRCLDYEGTPHVCSFPKPLAERRKDWGGWSTMTIQAPPKPQPWVKP